MTKHSHGEGGIYKRPNGTWLAQISAGGKRLSKTFPTRKEASTWLQKTAGQVRQGLTYDASKTNLEGLLDDWLSLKESKLRASTLELYATQIRNHIKPGLGGIRLMDLNPGVIQAFYSRLQEQGTGRRTIELCHSILHGCLKHAHRLGLVAQNWASLVEVPRPEKREMQVWNENQVSQFLAYAPDRAFYKMAFDTGMRRAELIGLQWPDLDWQSRYLIVRRQVWNPAGGGWRFQEPKTDRGRRKIRLGENLVGLLRRHFNEVLPLARAIAGERWQENDLIFPTSIGTPRDGYEVTKKFQSLAKEAGLPVIRFHDIRHTNASLLLSNLEPPVRVAHRLGMSLAVLLSTYAHYIPSDEGEERAAALMDAITSPVEIGFLKIATDFNTESLQEKENASEIEDQDVQ